MKLFLLTVTLITAVNVNCRKRTKPPDKQNSTGAKASLPDPPLTANLITSDISTGPESSLNSTQILEPQPKDFQERKYMNGLAKLGGGIKTDPCSSFGGKSVTQQCLSINEDSKTYEQAITSCKAKGHRLAVLQDPDAFKAYMKRNHGGKKYWLGGSDRHHEGLWTWINGQSLGDDFPWGPGEPNDAGGKEDCLEYAYGNYNDNKCTRKMGYVCEPDPCSSFGGKSVAQQCLSINEDSKTYEQAITSCKAKGRRLAVLQDPDAFKAYMKRNHGGKRYWLGGSDRDDEGLWTWINGQSLGNDFPWGPGEPNDAGGKEDCLEYRGGNYNDNTCTKTKGYVCEPGPRIVYKYITNYDLLWNDKGSGGDQDISIWRAKNFANGYYSIGDVAHDKYGRPNIVTIMVSAKTQGVLAPPASFTRIYIDSGNGAKMHLGVYRMNAPSGYRCLGGVTMGNHHEWPDKNRYRCIRNHYTVQGSNVFLYNDKGTGAEFDLSLWRVQRGADVHGIEGGNFVPNDNMWAKPASGYLLKEDGINVINGRNIPFDKVNHLNLHELSDIKEIWTDKGSGADKDVSIWRAEPNEGYYSIGDIAVDTWDKPLTAFVLTLSDPDDLDSLRTPTSYEEIWNDKGSGADQDVTIWRPICPGGYVALGNVATDGYGKRPDVKAFYCVKHVYVLAGYNDDTNWRYVWADYGSGAKKDVKIYEVVGASDRQQRSRGFGAIASYNNGYPRRPYLLKSESINYIAEPPIEKIEVFNVNYETNTASILKNPGTLEQTVIDNKSNIPQTVIREIIYSYTTSQTWEHGIAVSAGVSVKFTGGVPLIASNEITISVEVSYTHTWGTSETKTKTDKVRAEVDLPGNSKITTSISYNKYMTDIKYTADIKKYYYDGTTSIGKMSGVYKGVDIAEFRVVYGEIVSINRLLE